MKKKLCSVCGKITIMDNKNTVIYSGGIMHNSCWYCGKSFKKNST